VAGLRQPSSSLKAIGLGVAGAVVIVVLSLTVIPPNTTDITTELRNDPNLTLARMAFGFLVVGFVEEIVFRGVLFTRLEQIFAGGVWTLPLAGAGGSSASPTTIRGSIGSGPLPGSVSFSACFLLLQVARSGRSWRMAFTTRRVQHGCSLSEPSRPQPKSPTAQSWQKRHQY